MKKIIPIIIIAIIAVAAFFGMKSCNTGNSITDAISSSAESVVDGAKNVGDAAKDAASSATDAAKDAASSAADVAKDAASSAADVAKDAASSAADVAKDAASSATDAAKDAASSAAGAATGAMKALGDFFSVKLPNGQSLNIPKLGVENKLISFLSGSSSVDKNTWFDFDRINFNVGSAVLSDTSKEQLGNIVKILKAYPNLEMKVGGYTDNTGKAAFNMQLSKKRADAVKSAMVSMGVDAKRLTSEGYGSTNAIASNDTKEGREKNRRISLRVTKK